MSTLIKLPDFDKTVVN